MKRLTQAVITCSFILLFVSIFIQCKDAKKSDLTLALEILADDAGKDYPMYLDDFTRIDSVRVVGGLTVKYFVTSSYLTSSNITADEAVYLFKPNMVYTIQRDNEVKIGRDLGITFIYSYNDESGNFFCEIKITPDDYNKQFSEVEKKNLASFGAKDLESLIRITCINERMALPLQIDEQITLVDCKVLQNNTLAYIYTVGLDWKGSNTDFERNKKIELAKTLTDNRELKQMLDAGVIFHFVYYDKTGAEICEIKLASEDLK